MNRLTSNRTWGEVSADLAHELGYSHIWQRLNTIENIFGEEYDLEEIQKRLKNSRPAVYAHWELNGNYFECSYCSGLALKCDESELQILSDYCPNCGAIMEEVEDEC